MVHIHSFKYGGADIYLCDCGVYERRPNPNITSFTLPEAKCPTCGKHMKPGSVMYKNKQGILQCTDCDNKPKDSTVGETYPEKMACQNCGHNFVKKFPCGETCDGAFECPVCRCTKARAIGLSVITVDKELFK